VGVHIQSHLLTDRHPCAHSTLMQCMRSCHSILLCLWQIHAFRIRTRCNAKPPAQSHQNHQSNQRHCPGSVHDKSTFALIRLGLAVCSLTWVIAFKSMVHVIPILLHRHWAVVRRVGKADAHVLCRYVVCRQRSMQPLSQADLPHDLATCRRHQGGGECPP
jgi:hypothetical protein